MASAQDEETLPVAAADEADGDGRPQAGRAGDVRRRPGYAICPYLLVPDGGFRLSRADRDHRCVAQRPPDAPSLDRQRRLCLTADHRSCPAFEAARQRRAIALAEAGLSASTVEARRTRPFVRTTPLILSAGRGGRGGTMGVQTARSPAPSAERGARPDVFTTGAGRLSSLPRTARAAGLAALAMLAVAAFIVARLPAIAPGAPPTGSPAPGRSVSAVVASASFAPSTGAPGASPTPAASPSEPASTPAVSPAPSPTPANASAAPGAGRTYTVLAGDTLSAIAARYHVTVADLQALNQIKDPRLLRIGQVLKIP